jgi:hypothetical protein
LCEQLDYNLLFRWFVGLSMDDRIWDHSTFTKNRDRLIEAGVARKLLRRIGRRARREGLLWLALLRYVTPTLQAAAIAELTPKSTGARLASMTNEELWQVIVQSPEAAELVKQGVKTRKELLMGTACGPQRKALAAPEAPQPPLEPNTFIPDDEELLR